MAAFLVINYDVTDAEALDVYRQKAIPVLAGPGRGAPRVIADETIDLGEGNGVGTDTVILEFPSVQAAQEAFDSDAYQNIVEDRLGATVPRFAMIVPTRNG